MSNSDNGKLMFGTGVDTSGLDAGLSAAEKKLTDFSRRLNAEISKMGGLEKVVLGLNGQIGSFGDAAVSASAKVNELGVQGDKIGTYFKNMPSYTRTATTNIEDFGNKSDETKQKVQSLGQQVSKESEQISNAMRQMAGYAAGFFAVGQIKSFISQCAVVRGQFQQMEISFKTMLQSEEKANTLMNQLIKTAATTPFGMTEVVSGAKQLIAFGESAETVNDTLVRLGDIAAGTGAHIGQLTNVYGQIMAAGRMNGGDLLQFVNAGVPIIQALADTMGVAESNVKELISRGKVGFPEVRKALESLTDEGSKFGGMMEAQSHSITGQISNIEDDIEQMYNEIGKMNEGAISTALEFVSKTISYWREIGKAIMIVVAAYGTYKGALLAVAAAQKIMNMMSTVKAFISLAREVKTAKDMMLLFNMACSANPIGLIAGVVATAATAFALFKKDTSEATQQVEKFGESAAKQINKVDTLTTEIKGLTAGSSAHKKAMSELNDILKGYGLKQISEKDGIDAINKSREYAIQLIKEEGIEKQKANKIEEAAQKYQEGMKSIESGLINDYKNAIGNRAGRADEKMMEANAQAIAGIINNALVEGTGKTSEQIVADIKSRLETAGLDSDIILNASIHSFKGNESIIKTRIAEFQELSKAQSESRKQAELVAETERKLADTGMDATKKMEVYANQLQNTSESAKDLYNSVSSLVGRKSGELDYKISVDDVSVPEWMKKMDLKTLKENAIKFTAAGAAGNGIKGSGLNRQQTLTRGAQYAKAARDKQAQQEEAQKEQEANKKEQDRIKEQTAERNKAIRNYEKQVSEQISQTEIALRQKQIDAMEDGFEKQRAQIDLNYDRLINENVKRRKQMLEALAENETNRWNNANPNATKSQREAYKQGLLSNEGLLFGRLKQGQRDQLAAYDGEAEKYKQNAYKYQMEAILNEVKTYQQQRYDIEKSYTEKRKVLYESDGATLRKGVNAENVSELQRKQDEALKAVDEQFAQRSENYKQWCNEIATMSLDELVNILGQAKAQLALLETTGASGQKLAEARAKVAKAEEAIKKQRSKEKVETPDESAIKDWQELYSVLNDVNSSFKEIGDSVGDTVGDVINAASQIMTSTLQMINGIVTLTNTAATATTATATTASKAIQTVEKASVILAVISAAIQVAMAIANMFNNDKTHDKRIAQYQKQIDELEWEMNHQSTLALEARYGNGVDVVKEKIAETRKETEEWAKALFKAGNVSNVGKLYDEMKAKNVENSAKKLADYYADAAYSSNKLLGTEKYEQARKQLELLAKEQVLLEQQIEEEKSKKKKKQDSDKISESETKMRENAESMLTTISDMVDDIMGASAEDIASQLGDAFFDAAQSGEDAMTAWKTKANEIISDVMKRMLVKNLLEDNIGSVFDTYKEKWFGKDGNFAGADAVQASLTDLANDLNEQGLAFKEAFDELMSNEGLKELFQSTAERSGVSKGIATASQESVDENNARLTTIQGHTYSLVQGMQELTATSNAILEHVAGIEQNTAPLSEMSRDVRNLRNAVDDMQTRGINVRG